ncbi:MAG: hypothetical protein IJU32_09670 [Pyramidobacter sp.]|nr:hypothetical protein [Pyramidobacter sp.]
MRRPQPYTPKDDVTFGSMLRAARESQGMSPGELAARALNADALILAYESSKVLPFDKTIRVLCDILGLDFLSMSRQVSHERYLRKYESKERWNA